MKRLIMKKFVLLFLLISLISCLKNAVEIEPLKYAKADLVPLNDSTKSLYYNDAAYIEFWQVTQDSTKRYNQINLKEQNIKSHYEDLLNIYDNSYSISNSFFENISSIHTFDTYTLYHLFVSVDTSKKWVEEWFNGNKHTGIAGIDSLIENYDIEIIFSRIFFGEYNFILKTKKPINYVALNEKLEKTNEFRYSYNGYVEPDLGIGGSNISFIGGNQQIYQYALGWGDCPSGCSYQHYWKIKITDQKMTLLEEYGDPLK